MPTKPTTGGRRPRRRGATGVQLGEATARAMILGGAARVFTERGVREPSVDDILTEAGISRRTFYTLYASKEDVALALYQIGSSGLLEACRQAAAEEPDLLRRAERIVDQHLHNARGVGRLVYVLGGEAQRLETPLHARRMEMHEAMVALLSPAAPDVDPLLLRGLILALEGIVRIMLQEGDEGRKVTDAQLARARRVMLQLVRGALGPLTA